MGVHAPNNFRRSCMKFRTLAEAVQTGVAELSKSRGKSCGVHAHIIREKIIESFRARVVSGIFKKLGAEIPGKADDFKKMAIAIAREGGNAHAGENFSKPGRDCGTHAVCAAGLDGLGKVVGQIGHDSAGASSDEQGDVMRVKHLRGLDDEWQVPQALANHRFPNGGSGQKRGKRAIFRIDAAIGKEEEARTSAATQRGRR